MSDYENEDWDYVDLTGQRSTISGGEGFSDHVVPRVDVRDATKLTQLPETRLARGHRGTRLDESFYPRIQKIQPKAYHSKGSRLTHRPVETSAGHQSLESYRRSREHPDSPDDFYILTGTWSDLVRRLSGYDVSPEQMAHNRLNNLSALTQAYVEFPDSDSSRLRIWGTKSQCEQVKSQLYTWEMHMRVPSGKPSGKAWQKMNAYDGRREHRQLQEIYEQYEEQVFRDADDSLFNFEAYLVWPSLYDFDAYLKTYDVKALSDISKTFKCRFQHEKRFQIRYTRLQAQGEHELLAAYQRLIGLAKEMISQKNRGTYGNLFNVPSLETYREQIKVERDEITNTFDVVLTGKSAANSNEDDWAKLVRKMEGRTRRTLRDSLDTFLRHFYVSESQVRLRVDFGDLNLVSFQRPKEGSESYETEDFLELTQNPRTEFTDCLFRSKGKSMYYLVDVLGRMNEFHMPEEHYMVQYDFQNPEKMDRLRLETEMVRGYDADAVEVRAKRWLSLGHRTADGTVLGLKVLDLDKPCFMIRVDCYDLFTNEAKIRVMDAFQSVQSFKPAPDGLKAYPRRRSVFPPGQPDLMTVTEITSVRYRFENTDGTFEIRREDVFDQRTGKDSPWPVSSQWAASYYYHDWDALLGEFANIQPGEQVSWQQDILTFFPDHIDESNPQALPQGFKSFLREVGRIQNLLKSALAQLPDIQTNSISTDRPQAG